MKLFPGKKQNLHAPQVSDYQDFQISECQINGILVYYVQKN
jgi:hypothetical protein